MTTATLEKRVRALEEEVRELKEAALKKLPKGVLAGLRDLKAGKIVGSFSSGQEMRRSFEK